jgi:hypothetical protein
MHANPWSDLRHRLPCAAAALLASTLVLSSVLWLFANASAPTTGSLYISRPDHSEGLAASHRIDAGRIRDQLLRKTS